MMSPPVYKPDKVLCIRNDILHPSGSKNIRKRTFRKQILIIKVNVLVSPLVPCYIEVLPLVITLMILTSLMILISIQLLVELVISLKNNGASDK